MQRTMLVTGAASGIGRAIAVHFARSGWFVGLADINRDGLAEAGREIDAPHVLLPLDVEDSDAWASAVAAFAVATGQRLDVFVNNAGIAHSGRFEDIPLSAAIKTVDVNLVGAIRGIYACLPLLKATPDAQLINMGSSSGLCGYPGMAVYSASKAGLMALSEALSMELAAEGIRVTTIAPHFITTPMLASSYHRRRPNGPDRHQALDAVRQYGVERVVAAVEDAIANKPSRIVVGGEAKGVAWLRRFFPGVLHRIMLRRWQKLMGN